MCVRGGLNPQAVEFAPTVSSVAAAETAASGSSKAKFKGGKVKGVPGGTSKPSGHSRTSTTGAAFVCIQKKKKKRRKKEESVVCVGGAEVADSASGEVEGAQAADSDKTVTGTGADGVPGQSLGAAAQSGEREEAEGAHVADSGKTVTGSTTDGVPDQLWSASTRRLFALVTDLEKRMLAAHSAAMAQAVVHGTLQADLEAAKARVAAVPMPPKTPGGASAKVRREAQAATRRELEATVVAECARRCRRSWQVGARHVARANRLAGDLANAEAAAQAAARAEQAAELRAVAVGASRGVSFDDTVYFAPVPALGSGQWVTFGSFPNVWHWAAGVPPPEPEPEIVFGSFIDASEGPCSPPLPPPPRVPPGESVVGTLRAAAVSPCGGTGLVPPDGCPHCGSVPLDCVPTDGERHFGLDGLPVGPDGKPLVRGVPEVGRVRLDRRCASVLQSAPRLSEAAWLSGEGSEESGRREGTAMAAAAEIEAAETLEAEAAGAAATWRAKAAHLPVGEDASTARARTSTSTRARRSAARLVGLLDTGAGSTFLTTTHGTRWRHRALETVTAADAQGHPFIARGGEALWGTLTTVDGRAITEMVARKAYVADSITESLIAYPALYDAGWHLVDSPVSAPVLEHRGGAVVELTRDGDGHLWLEFEVAEAPAAADSREIPDADDERCLRPFSGAAPARALAVPSSSPGRPRRPGGAGPMFQWTSQLLSDGASAEAAAGDVAGMSASDDMVAANADGDSGQTGLVDGPVSRAKVKATPDDPASGAVDPEVHRARRAAEAAAQLELAHANYRFSHEAMNHKSSTVDRMIAEGLLTNTARPPGFSCAACSHADPSGAHFRRRTKVSPSMPLVPYHHVEIDLWGPMDVGDRNGFRYVFGGICRATGKVFLQPLRRKSGAEDALRRYLALIRAQCPGIEVHLRRWDDTVRVPGLAIVSSDRAGEFTCTHGYTETAVDALLRDIVHRLNTPGMPQSGTSRIERLWETLPKATRCHLYTSGLGKQYYFDAMVYAGDVFNCSPTDANKLGRGEAPDATLGLDHDLGRFVPFGSLAYHLVPGAKADDKNELVVIIGLNHDGHGYRVLRVSDGTVFVSLDVKAHPDLGTARTLLDKVNAGVSPSSASFVAQHCNCGETLVDVDRATRGGHLMNLIETQADTEAARAAPPLIQQFGNPPGHGGSRASLRPRVPPAEFRAGSRSPVPSGRASAPRSPIYDAPTTRALLRDARAAGQVLRWRPGFSKTGKSGERYQFYSKARTFAQFDAMTKETYLSGITGTQRPKAIRSDLNYDAARGIVTFLDADTPPTPGQAVVDCAGPGGGASGGADARNEGDGSGGSSEDGDDVEDETSPPHRPSTVGFGRHRRRRAALRAAKAFARKGLTAEETALLEAGLRAKSAYVDVPDVIMMAAIIRHEGVRIPKSISEAIRSPQWPQWLEALKKEYGGLLSKGVFNEVDRSAVPAGSKVVPTQTIFDIKKDGTFKVRIVVRGDLMVEGEHFVDTKSSMVSLDAIRMVVSLAAGNDMRLFSTDFSQAFLNADIDMEGLFCGLPDLPKEMLGGEFGRGKAGGKVAHVRKAWYGLPQSPMLWEAHLHRFVTGPKLGARILVNDRNVFEWEWQGQRLFGAVHVDDMLFAVSSLEIRDEFMRRLRDEFEVTGGEEEATDFCGLEITRDWDNHTVSLKQTAFARKMMASYGMLHTNPELTPLRVGAPKLEPWEGEATEVETFDYMMFVGDLAWYSRTNPGLSFAVHHLAQFMQRPGPAHVKAARRVLRYIRGNLDAGLTYHGSADVMAQSYDHLNKLIASFDADFPHDGQKAPSGFAVLLNGAAVA